MNFAVVEIAGKQFIVRKGDVIETPKIAGSTGDKVALSSVLLGWDGKSLAVGRPRLEGCTVEGKILGSGRGHKVVAYKFKRRKDSHRKIGHRQDFIRMEIVKIVLPGQASGAEEEKTPAAKPAPARAAGRGRTASRKKAPSAAASGGRKKPAAGKKPKGSGKAAKSGA